MLFSLLFAFAPLVASAASLSASPASGAAPLSVSFNASGGTVLEFGDGSTATCSDSCEPWRPSHTYTAGGTYTASLKGGGKVLATKQILVSGPAALPTCTMSITPSVVSPGGSITLTWSSTNATGGTITGLGSVAPSGRTNLVVPLNPSTTFLGTFTGSGGTAQCQATVRVGTDAGVGTGDSGTSAGGIEGSQNNILSNPDTGASAGTRDTTGITAPVVPVTSSTLPPPGSGSTGGLVPCRGIDCNLCAAGTLIQRIINFMIGISIPLAALLFAWAGALYFSSGANPGNKDKAKQIFIDAFVGFLIALAAFLVVQTLLKVLMKDTYQSWNSIQCVSQEQRPGTTPTNTKTINDVLRSVLPSLSVSNNPSPIAPNFGGGYQGSGWGDTVGLGDGSGSSGGSFSGTGAPVTGEVICDDEYGCYSTYTGTNQDISRCGGGSWEYIADYDQCVSRQTEDVRQACAAGSTYIPDYDECINLGGGGGLKGTEQWLSGLEAACAQYGLDDCALAQATMARESGGNCSLTGPTKDYGCMQVTCPAAKDYDPTGWARTQDCESIKSRLLTDTDYNIAVGVNELKSCYNYTGGDIEKTAACYNGGRGALSLSKDTINCSGIANYQCPTYSWSSSIVKYTKGVSSTYGLIVK